MECLSDRSGREKLRTLFLRQLRVERMPYGQLQSKGSRFPSRAKYEWLIKFCSAATSKERRELERIQPCTIAALTKKKYSSHGGKLYKIVRLRGKNIDVLNEVIPVDELFDWLCDNYEGDEDEKEFKARADELQVDMTMEAINAFTRVIQKGNKLLASYYRRRSKVRQPNVEEVEIEEEGVDDDGDEEVGDGDEEVDDGDEEADVPSAGSGDGDNDDTETEESSSDSEEPEDDDSDFNDNDANEIQNNAGRGKKGLKAYARRSKRSAESSPKQQQHSQDPKRPREMETSQRDVASRSTPVVPVDGDSIDEEGFSKRPRRSNNDGSGDPVAHPRTSFGRPASPMHRPDHGDPAHPVNEIRHSSKPLQVSLDENQQQQQQQPDGAAESIHEEREFLSEDQPLAHNDGVVRDNDHPRGYTEPRQNAMMADGRRVGSRGGRSFEDVKFRHDGYSGMRSASLFDSQNNDPADSGHRFYSGYDDELQEDTPRNASRAPGSYHRFHDRDHARDLEEDSRLARERGSYHDSDRDSEGDNQMGPPPERARIFRGGIDSGFEEEDRKAPARGRGFRSDSVSDFEEEEDRRKPPPAQAQGFRGDSESNFEEGERIEQPAARGRDFNRDDDTAMAVAPSLSGYDPPFDNTAGSYNDDRPFREAGRRSSRHRDSVELMHSSRSAPTFHAPPRRREQYKHDDDDDDDESVVLLLDPRDPYGNNDIALPRSMLPPSIFKAAASARARSFDRRRELQNSDERDNDLSNQRWSGHSSQRNVARRYPSEDADYCTGARVKREEDSYYDQNPPSIHRDAGARRDSDEESDYHYSSQNAPRNQADPARQNQGTQWSRTTGVKLETEPDVSVASMDVPAQAQESRTHDVASKGRRWSLAEAYQRFGPGKQRILSDGTEVRCLYPRLQCAHCCPHGAMITVFSDEYDEARNSTKRWMETDFVSSFALLMAHTYHNPKIKVVISNFEGEVLDESQVEKLDSEVEQILSIVLDPNHFAVVCVDIARCSVNAIEGLRSARSLRRWEDHVLKILMRAGLLPLGTAPGTLGRFELTHVTCIAQYDSHNCAAIACGMVWEMLSQKVFRSRDYSSALQLRTRVVDKYREMIESFQHDLDIIQQRPSHY